MESSPLLFLLYVIGPAEGLRSECLRENQPVACIPLVILP